MTPDSYLSLVLILLSSTVICWLHGEEFNIQQIIYLFQINFLSLVSTFFSIFNSYASIRAPLAEKDTFYRARVEQHHITEKPQTTAVSKTGKKTVEYAFFYFKK